MQDALEEAKLAVSEGLSPSGNRGQRLVGDWIEASARAAGEHGDARFTEWMLSHHERTYDPRMERYWELIASLKRWKHDPTLAKAYGWLIERLRRRVAGS